MAKGLTLEHFDEMMGVIKESINNIEANMVTKDDLKNDLAAVENRLTGRFEHDLESLENRLGERLNEISTDLDKYLKRTETWYSEQLALRTRTGRLERTLVRKQVLTEDDLTAFA